MSWLWPFNLSWGNKRKPNIILSYTEELNKLSIQINSIEKKLNDKRPYIRYFHFYGLPLLLSLTYYYIHKYVYRSKEYSQGNLSCWTIYIIVSVIIYCIIIYILLKLISWERKYYTDKLSKLRSQYDDTLNQFKEDTQFNESISMLQRFNGGIDQMELVNEELKGKYDELNKLRLEIDKLKHKSGSSDNGDNKVWLDKIVGLMSGGDDILVKVLCPKCKKFNGLYRYVNEPIEYRCVDCGMEVHEINKGDEATHSQSKTENEKMD